MIDISLQIWGGLLRSLGLIPRRLRRLKIRSTAKIPRLSEAKVEPQARWLATGFFILSSE
jgi:hypothetical protein